jgi:glycosyltransferase involved in cell wall biosynthesis
MNGFSLSTVIITKNDEGNIDDCLQSVKWADQIVVVDAESTDRTPELARHYTPLVITKHWEGYGPQKNFGILQATGDWILFLDADERVSPELAKEIQARLAMWTSGDPVAFCVPRRNLFYGEWVRWGGAYPDLQIRLFQKGKASYHDVEIHESLIVEGAIGNLGGHLVHYTERRIVDHFRKFSLSITLDAKEQAKTFEMVYWWHLLLNPLATFFKKYFLKQGFRDGIRGVIYAGFASMYTFGKYVKLWEMNWSASPVATSKKQ